MEKELQESKRGQTLGNHKEHRETKDNAENEAVWNTKLGSQTGESVSVNTREARRGLATPERNSEPGQQH